MNTLIAYTTIAAQPGRDPWQPYEKGKKPPKHPIPEPATYLAITIAILIVLLARWGRGRKQ